MDKESLRNKLFDKYFEVEEGILATELVDKLAFIPNAWQELHLLCEKYIKYFDKYSYLDKFKAVEYNEKKYLILKLRLFRYVIIDMQKMECITDEQFINTFDEALFVNNFDEIESKDWKIMYRTERYSGDLQELVDFYISNEQIFSLSSELNYKLNINDALTYFCISFINANAQIGFQTPDQFLYEHLFLNFDLTASRMQDAQEKIGVERIHEMFNKIKDIKIPKEVIPADLYQQFLIQSNLDNNVLTKSNHNRHQLLN